MANYNGTNGPDVYIGTEGADTIFGNDGNDTLQGRGGDDVIDGGAGNDFLRGGSGVDTFIGGIDDGDAPVIGGDYGDRISFVELAATQGVIADLRSGIISNDGFGNQETMTESNRSAAIRPSPIPSTGPTRSMSFSPASGTPSTASAVTTGFR